MTTLPSGRRWTLSVAVWSRPGTRSATSCSWSVGAQRAVGGGDRLEAEPVGFELDRPSEPAGRAELARMGAATLGTESGCAAAPYRQSRPASVAQDAEWVETPAGGL